MSGCGSCWTIWRKRCTTPTGWAWPPPRWGFSAGRWSCPGEYGKVKRPARVKVEAQNRYGDPVEYVGTELLARAFCHEIDHLDGIVFKDKVVEMVQVEE